MPVGLWKTLFIQTPSFGILLLGGDVDQYGLTNMVLYLSTVADPWQVVPQKMKYGRINHAGVALVNPYTVNCTEASTK